MEKAPIFWPLYPRDLDANQAEPVNQAVQKIKSATIPIHRVKGQPVVSTYVREKGCIKCDTHHETPL